MEIKTKLNKPYTEKQRLDFIVKNNHTLGYEIRESETALEAWGYTEEEIDEQERERIAGLKLTKRVFALALQEFEITYSQLKELISTNEQAQLEWDLCVELERSNPLLNVMGAKLGITPEQLDYIFRKANGEEVEPPEVEEPTDEEPEEEMDNG